MFSNFLVTHITCLLTTSLLLSALPTFSTSSLITLYILILSLLHCQSSLSLSISLKAMNPSEEFVEQEISQQVMLLFLPIELSGYFNLSVTFLLLLFFIWDFFYFLFWGFISGNFLTLGNSFWVKCFCVRINGVV